jgi:hypothetical protein
MKAGAFLNWRLLVLGIEFRRAYRAPGDPLGQRGYVALHVGPLKLAVAWDAR